MEACRNGLLMAELVNRETARGVERAKARIESILSRECDEEE